MRDRLTGQEPVPDAAIDNAEDAVRSDMLPIAEDDRKWLEKIMASHRHELEAALGKLPDFARRLAGGQICPTLPKRRGLVRCPSLAAQSGKGRWRRISRSEEVWRDLRHHLEWADGFALILLFARHPAPVAALRERVADGMKLRTQKLRILVPTSPEEVRGLASEILAVKRAPDGGSVWVELWRNPSDLDWQKARRRLLHSMNERRYLLERDLRAPLILVLPAETRGQFYIDAPDLWTIRSFTTELGAPTAQPVRQPLEKIAPPDLSSGLESLAEQEWARLRREFRAIQKPCRRRPAPA